MIKCRYRNVFLFICLFVVYASSATAQRFNNTVDTNKPQSAAAQSNSAGDWSKFYQKSKTNVSAASSSETKKNNTKDQSVSDKRNTSKNAKQVVDNPEDYVYKKVRQIDRPTLDGVKRGRTSVVPLIRDGKTTAEGYIYLFYSDFSLHKMMSGSMMCDVKFQILTTFDRKLNSLAIRLKWPNMETPLTFIDVNPNQKYHMTYSLMGDGCYSMDKIPNVIVNRCRIKGMTQEECAQRVRWIKKK